MELTADDTPVVVAKKGSQKYHKPGSDLGDDPVPECEAAAKQGYRWSTKVAIEPVYEPCERCFD